MKVDAAHGKANCHHVPRDMMAKKDTAHASVVLLQSTRLEVHQHRLSDKPKLHNGQSFTKYFHDGNDLLVLVWQLKKVVYHL